MSALATTPWLRQPRGPCSAHFIRLLPISMARTWLTAKGTRNVVADRRERARTVAGYARRSEISPARNRARRGPSASTSAPLASTPATLPVTVAPSGSSSFTILPW